MIAKGFHEHEANVLLTSRSKQACQEATESLEQEQLKQQQQ
jgi:short-subunit dehydrogenase